MLARFNINRNKKQLVVVKEGGNRPNLREKSSKEKEKRRDRCKLDQRNMGRSPCCDESGLKKGPWTPDEDDKLVNYVQKHGHSSWRALPKLAGLNRCGKSCRLRWTNYLRPDIKRGKFSPDEEQTILNLHAVLGNKWSTIANHLPGRTDNEIKNFWNTHLKKKLIQMGFDPMTHRPRTDLFSSLSQLMSMSSNLRGFADMQQQFPTDQDQTLLKLQTEVAKLQLFQYFLQPPSMNNINPNEFDHTLNLLNSIASFKNTTSLDLGFIGSYLQDFNSLPSLKTLNSNIEPPASVFPQNIDENHFKFFSDQRENNLPVSPMWLSDPSSSNHSLLPSLDPSSALSDDLITNQYVIEDVNSNITSSTCQESASAAWPDHLLDDSVFSDIL